METIKPKNKTIMFMVTEEFKERVRLASNQDNKTLSSYISDLLLIDLNRRDKKNGIDKD